MKKLTFFFLLLSFQAFSHPVIYKGGWVISSANMPDYSTNYIMYSLSHRYAVGLEQWRFTKEEEVNDLGLFKLNHLLWRHNGKDSQANIYLHAGLGVEDQDIGEKQTRASLMGGIEADWESRVLYTAAKFYQFQDLYVSQARVGFSPKETSFDKLQTWFMLQAMVIDEVQEKLMLTPMVRFFYHNVLWELGSSTRGDWMINLMVHY